jgi:hypothetical protein
VLEIATAFFICVDGFLQGQDIDIQVLLPDGTTRGLDSANLAASNGTSAGGAELIWTSLPGDPVGEYTITATQGERQAAATFNILPASEPRFAVVPRTGPPGTTFQIQLVGFPPNQEVAIHLYRLEDRVWRYTTSLPTSDTRIQTDERGQATYELATQADDLATAYMLVTVPAAQAPRIFSDRDFVVLPASQ